MDKLSYALGMSMASNLMNSGLRNIDVASFTDAFKSIFSNQATSISSQEANQIIQEFFNKRQNEVLTRNLEEESFSG